MISVSEAILKRRAAVERWKSKNRERYLKQKRELSARPEYRAKMRAKYAAEREELKQAGILPRKMGRPRLYSGEEAIDAERERARKASARYRARKKISQVYQNNESTTSPDTSSESDRSGDRYGHTTKCTSLRHWIGPANEWTISDTV